MSTTTSTEATSQKGFFGWVERVGNKVPHPSQIFLWGFFLVLFLSWGLNMLGVSVTNPGTGEVVAVANLLTSASIANILRNVGTVYAGFTPMLTVPLCALGMGVANHSGLLGTALKLVGLSRSKLFMTLLVAFIGVQGNLAGDIAGIIYPMLVAMLFHSTGRNPIAGLLLAYCSVNVGFGANVLISAGDASLAGMTGAAAQMIDPTFETSPAMGYYFMCASSFFLAPILSFVCLKIVEPKLDAAGMGTNASMEVDLSQMEISEKENKGLKMAGLTVVGIFAACALMCLPGLPFAAPEGKTVLDGALLKSVATIVFLVFFLSGYVYGSITGKIKRFSDTAPMMGAEIKALSSFFVVSFFASQFISVFGSSKIAIVVAVKGGELLKASGLGGPVLLALFVILIAFVNIFMSSASSKWALLSTVFVPMFMISGISPAAVQVAYRMGDGMTNAMTPISAALVVMLTYAQQYDERAKLGTVLSYTMPFCLYTGAIWIVIFLIWTLIGLPVGPGYVPFL